MSETDFVNMASLMCEPVRAKVLWKLLDGRAYTATELAHSVNVSPTTLSNHLSKLLKGGVLAVVAQGRHRYYSFANAQIAYAVESMAHLVQDNEVNPLKKEKPNNGVTYCRSCYDHLAGYVGVRIANAMTDKGYLKPSGKDFLVSDSGWNWLGNIGIYESDFLKSRRPLARQCLDWSERRPHLAGHLGALMMKKFIENHWFKPVKFSREIIVTSKGRQEIFKLLGIDLV